MKQLNRRRRGRWCTIALMVVRETTGTRQPPACARAHVSDSFSAVIPCGGLLSNHARSGPLIYLTSPLHFFKFFICEYFLQYITVLYNLFSRLLVDWCNYSSGVTKNSRGAGGRVGKRGERVARRGQNRAEHRRPRSRNNRCLLCFNFVERTSPDSYCWCS